MSKKIGGFSQFLNTSTKEAAAKKANEKTIIEIEISKLKNHPDNFYRVDNIDTLAALIANNRFYVEPLEVKEDEEKGFYTLIGGHRRKSAWELLLKEGKTTKTTLPCVVSTFAEEVVSYFENGEEKKITFSPEYKERMALISSNIGQRQEKPLEVLLWEIKEMEPYARAKYYERHANKEIKGTFKNFFAEEILHMSPSDLQRKKSLLKLTEKAQQALFKDKIISETFAVEIASLLPEEQDEFIALVASKKIQGIVKDVREFKKERIKESDTDIDDASSETMVSDTTDTIKTERPDADVKEKAPLRRNDECNTMEDTSEHSPVAPKNTDEKMREEKDTFVSEEKNNPEDPSAYKMLPQNDTAIYKDAYEWFAREQRPAYEGLLKKAEEARNIAAVQGNTMESALWDVKISVVRYMLESLSCMPSGMGGSIPR